VKVRNLLLKRAGAAIYIFPAARLPHLESKGEMSTGYAPFPAGSFELNSQCFRLLLPLQDLLLDIVHDLQQLDLPMKT
jgi:hypothetical protein